MIIEKLLFFAHARKCHISNLIYQSRDKNISKTKISKQKHMFENLKAFPMKENVFSGYVKSTPIRGKYQFSGYLKSTPVHGKYQISFEIQKRIQNFIKCLRWSHLLK